ncbi:L,D-transpeptidase family protein [Oryzifoliimicrobium ureilyticus]|uniref:L,D-transpeptidase family protein n=1 Tax=Oryzifoliimicrobium ureilyticus TaxID=3113724 RepID=UPI00307627C7
MFSRLLIGWLAATALISPALAGDRPILQIFVSKKDQSLVVYDGQEPVATSRVSSGKPGHDTPTGIFSVLEKQIYHESNIYSAAPMPFMQRLTWSGIALHESKSVPRYRASHGCVRLPSAFAKQLYKMTTLGVPVIISDTAVEPAPVNNVSLFEATPPAPQLFSDATLRPGVGDPTGKPIELAMNAVRPISPILHDATADDTAEPIKILITRRSQRETVIDLQTLLGQLGFAPGPADGLIGDATIDAINAFKKLRPETFAKDKSLISDNLLRAVYEAAGKGSPPNGVIMVRKGFKPLFEAPVDIASAQQALGTHFLILQSATDGKDGQQWLGVTLENKLPPQMMKRLGIQSQMSSLDFATPLEGALGRITVSDEAKQKIADMLVAGTTVTISDSGLGAETGNGTDFITVTHR